MARSKATRNTTQSQLELLPPELTFMVFEHLNPEDMLAVKLVSKSTYSRCKKLNGKDIISTADLSPSALANAHGRIEQKWPGLSPFLYCSDCRRLRPRRDYPDNHRARKNRHHSCMHCLFHIFPFRSYPFKGVQCTRCTKCKQLLPRDKLKILEFPRALLCEECYAKLPEQVLKTEEMIKQEQWERATKRKYGMFGRRRPGKH